jgi:hypothetical protein
MGELHGAGDPLKEAQSLAEGRRRLFDIAIERQAFDQFQNQVG